MVLEKSTKKLWNDLREYGDVSKISEDYDVDRRAIERAYKAKSVKVDVYLIMNEFYNARLKKLTKNKSRI